jgi:two-component system chemotaxis response regulator CheY
LVVDDEHYMRKVVKAMLMSLGVRHIFEAADGPLRAGSNPHTRSQRGYPRLANARSRRRRIFAHRGLTGHFPHAGVPIIMLTGHGERSRVLEAIKVGVNEFLLKPASQNALRERLVAVLINPRPLVRHCDYYGRPRARWLPRRCTKTTTRQSPISTC